MINFNNLGFALLATAALSTAAPAQSAELSAAATETADYASRYEEEIVATLASLVSYKTVADTGLELSRNPAFTGFRSYVKTLATSFGLEVEDHGELLIVSLGKQTERLGIMTHGDVQPADPGKWAQDPFTLDQTSEPGLLVARGTEDDKAAIATALYALRSIQESQVQLKRRIELMIYLAEETDWTALEAYIANHEMPKLNITIDASYPVVMAEKGSGLIQVTIPRTLTAQPNSAPTPAVLTITRFSGGVFRTQIPEDAVASVNGPDAELEDLKGMLEEAAEHQSGMEFHFVHEPGVLNIQARGKSAHSAAPQNGINAVQFLAALLGTTSEKVSFAPSPALYTVQFIHELVGTGYTGEQFGELAYSHPFMGSLTLAATIVKEAADGVQIAINTRRPVGKTAISLNQETSQAVAAWQARHGIEVMLSSNFGEPMLIDKAPHVSKLLDIFSHYTGIADPQPLSIGGSTNAKLLPNAVSFGPAMPGAVYTGHSEHEFISVAQLNLNLKMYTAMMIEIANL